MKYDTHLVSTRPGGLFNKVAMAAAFCLLPAAAQAQAPLPIKICSIDDRSGAAADTGNEGYNGVMMAIDPINAKGGINGKKIELIVYDSKTDPQLAATFATRCAEDDHGLMMIGPSPTPVASGMVPVSAQYKIPLYILSASADGLITPPAEYQFRFGPRTSQDAIYLADSIAKQGFKKVGIINISEPSRAESAKNTAIALEKKGIKVVAEQSYDVSATDVSPQVINLRQAGPDVVVIFPYPADGARVLRTMRQLDLKVPMIMPRVGLIETTRKLAGEASDGLLIPTSVDVSRPDVKEFFDLYNSKYKPVQPSPYVGTGYDAATLAVKVLADAEVQKAISTGKIADARAAIRDATERLGKFSGISGEKGMMYQFSKEQHNGAPDVGTFVYTEVADKGTKLVAPDMNKFKPKS